MTRLGSSWRFLVLVTVVVMAWLFGVSVSATQDQPSQRSLRHHMRDMAEPGAMHAVLASLEGTWTVSARMRMTPDANPERASGRATYSWILGDRFLQQELVLRSAGRNIEGYGLLGYDKYGGAYSGIWVTTNDSGVVLVSGSLDETGSILELSVTGNDPRFEQPLTRSARLEIIDRNTHVWRVFETHPDTGEEIAMVSFSYRREGD